MKAKFKHTNIVARDWQTLALFYKDVFSCIRVPPERHLSGDWLEKGTGVTEAKLSGIHLALPGQGDNAPTLEIYEYSQNEPKPAPVANREGFGHIAFEVDNVEEALAEVIKYGGATLGNVTSHEVEGVGVLSFIYVTDPEGNIVELQSWK